MLGHNLIVTPFLLGSDHDWCMAAVRGGIKVHGDK